MKTKAQIQEQLTHLQDAILMEKPSFELMPWELAHKVKGRSPLNAAALTLMWVLENKDND